MAYSQEELRLQELRRTLRRLAAEHSEDSADLLDAEEQLWRLESLLS